MVDWKTSILLKEHHSFGGIILRGWQIPLLTLPSPAPKHTLSCFLLSHWRPLVRWERQTPPPKIFQQCLGDWLLFTFVFVLKAHRVMKNFLNVSTVWMLMASLFPGLYSPSPFLTPKLSLWNGKYSSCWWRINTDCCRHLPNFLHIWLIYNKRKWIKVWCQGRMKRHTCLSAQGWGSLCLLAQHPVWFSVCGILHF